MPEKEKTPAVAEGPNIRDELNSINTRIRLAEERYSELRQRLNFLEKNVIEHNKKQAADIRELSAEMIELKKRIGEFENKMMLVIKELGLTAKREDIEVVKKYIELWNPVKFLTEEGARKIVREILGEKDENLIKSSYTG